MSPTAKDLDVANASSTTPGVRPASVGSQDDSVNRPQPVPLEVPVTVNGARTVEGSDKREPFSETTQTVLVFGNGAVIRLASSVAAGQLLFLTNEKTKKEVVCQVVKSKNYRNVSGYVELEFTEAVPGFWGMRFPGERPAAQPSGPIAGSTVKPSTPPVVAPKPQAPAAGSIPQRTETKQPLAPPRTDAPTTSTLHAEVKPALNLPRAPEPKPITTLPSPQHVSPLSVSTAPSAVLPKAPGLADGFGSGLTSTAPVSESRTQFPAAPKAPSSSVSTQTSTPSPSSSSDALKRESERLQEQLASMLFAADVPATPVKAPQTPPATSQSSISQTSSPQTSSKVVEIARPQTPAAKLAPPIAPASLPSSLDTEEVKIPSWLEPLARNAATHGQNDLGAKVDAQADRLIEFEVQDVSAPVSTPKEEVPAPAPAEAQLSSHLFEEEAQIHPQGAPGKNKGVLIGAIAAGLLAAVAGGTWYARRSAAPTQPAAATTTAPATASAAVAPNVAQSAAPPRNSSGTPTPNRSNINSEPVPQSMSQPASSQANSNSPSVTPASQMLKVAGDKNVSAELSAYKKLAEPQPVVKKPSIGEVHLAAPKASRAAGSMEVGEAEELSMNGGHAALSGDAMGGGLASGNTKQPVAPAAPLPVGGDVRPAHLLSSTPPVYPALAKIQHVQGAVMVDAVVDASGRITSTKVISGPILLHQAAMDALRQWKYQPATLDGQPVPMHLTVTVQFRLQ
jgi:TonB family protein